MTDTTPTATSEQAGTPPAAPRAPLPELDYTVTVKGRVFPMEELCAIDTLAITKFLGKRMKGMRGTLEQGRALWKKYQKKQASQSDDAEQASQSGDAIDYGAILEFVSTTVEGWDIATLDNDLKDLLCLLVYGGSEDVAHERTTFRADLRSRDVLLDTLTDAMLYRVILSQDIQRFLGKSFGMQINPTMVATIKQVLQESQAQRSQTGATALPNA